VSLTEHGWIKTWGIEKEFWLHPLRKDENVPILEDVWEDKKGEYFKRSVYADDFSLDAVLREEGFVYWVPNYVIKSPRECKSIAVDPKDLKYRVLMIHKEKDDLKGTNVLKYLEWGKEQGFHERPTCKSRKRWYDLGKWSFATYFWTEFFFERCKTFHSISHIFESDKHYGIIPKEGKQLVLGAYLNSSLVPLFRVIGGFQALGEGVLKMPVYEVAKIPVINPELVSNSKIEEIFKKIENRETKTLYEELGANTPKEVSLEKVKPDRRELDKIIMGEILGLTEEEQLEVYKAVIDRVKSRIEKARSVSRKKKAKAPDPEKIAEGVLREIDTSNLKSFPDGYISGKYKQIEVPEGSPESGSDLKGFFVKVGGERIECESPEEAEYINYAVISGFKKVKIPVDKKNLKKAIREYKKAYKGVEKEIEQYLKRFIPDKKLRERIEGVVWKKLKGGERVGELKAP